MNGYNLPSFGGCLESSMDWLGENNKKDPGAWVEITHRENTKWLNENRTNNKPVHKLQKEIKNKSINNMEDQKEEVRKPGIVLPTQIRKATAVNPENMAI